MNRPFISDGLHQRLISTKVISGMQMSNSAPNLASMHGQDAQVVAVPSSIGLAAAGHAGTEPEPGSPLDSSLVGLGGLAPAAVQPLETLINSLNLRRFENYLESLAFDRPPHDSATSSFANPAVLSVQIASTATLTESDGSSQHTDSSSSGAATSCSGCSDNSVSAATSTRPARPASQPPSLARPPPELVAGEGRMVHAYTQTCSCLGVCSEHISSSVPESLNQHGLESGTHHMYSELLLEKFKSCAEKLVVAAYEAYMLKLARNKANFGDLSKAAKRRPARDKLAGQSEQSATSLSLCDESSSSSPLCSASPTPLHSRQRTFDSGLNSCKTEQTALPPSGVPSIEVAPAATTEQHLLSSLASSSSAGCVATPSQNDAASEEMSDSQRNSENDAELAIQTDTEDADDTEHNGSVAGFDIGSLVARDDSDDSRSSLNDADLYYGNSSRRSPRREYLPDEF